MQKIRPSTLLSMTLPMFEMLTFQGTQNAKTLTNIVDNLNTLYKALLRIEAEVNGETQKEEPKPHDDNDEQESDV